MTKDEALKLALEALEEAWYHVGTFQPTEKAIDLYDEARTAIKEALAQPERDYERGFIDGMQKQMQSSVDKAVNRMAQPEQESVAWMVYTQEGRSAFVTDNPAQIHPSQRALPLYATPQRTWVGLTKDEQNFVYRNLHNATSRKDSFWVDFANAIETKLRSKNT